MSTSPPDIMTADQFAALAQADRSEFDVRAAKAKMDEISRRLEAGLGRMHRDDIANLQLQYELQKFIIDKALPNYRPIDRITGKSIEPNTITLSGLKVD